MRRYTQVQQSLQQPGYECGAGHAQVAGLPVDRRVQPRSGFGVETDVGPIGGKRRDAIAPLAKPGQVIGN
jgi:hypothetical protein